MEEIIFMMQNLGVLDMNHLSMTWRNFRSEKLLKRSMKHGRFSRGNLMKEECERKFYYRVNNMCPYDKKYCDGEMIYFNFQRNNFAWCKCIIKNIENDTKDIRIISREELYLWMKSGVPMGTGVRVELYNFSYFEVSRCPDVGIVE
jgi:hypothetical protein